MFCSRLGIAVWWDMKEISQLK